MATQLRRETLVEQLADRLLQQIQDQPLDPGEFLPSAASLADDFGVSRPVVREALRILEARGVIRTENGRGTIVQPLNSDLLTHYFNRISTMEDTAIIELLEVRKGLEVESARLAASRASDDELEAIAELVFQMQRAVGQHERYADLDTELHLAIAAATHNTTLYHLIDSIRGPLHSTIGAGLRSRVYAVHHQRVQQLHEELAEALQDRDPATAASVMALHFDEAVQHIVAAAGTSAIKGERR